MPKKSKKIDGGFSVKGLRVFYDQNIALSGIDMEIKSNEVTALIGPSGCGKSTFLRCLNRMNDLIKNFRLEGKILLNNEDIYNNSTDLVNLRSRVGMVFQKPNPFPQSIYNNIAYGPRLHRIAANKSELNDLVEQSLVRAGLFHEVKDRLNENALSLSGGQQQRLCIARALSISPEVLLMDEPCSALDPISTAKIEELIDSIKDNLTVVIITHNMQQAARVSQSTAFFHMGNLVEMGETGPFFTKPKDPQTCDYITGRFG